MGEDKEDPGLFWTTASPQQNESKYCGEPDRITRKSDKGPEMDMAKEERRKDRASRAKKKQEVLEKRIVNLSSIKLTPSETSILQKGLNFYPTPPPPRIEELDKDIDSFARRIYLKEYHASEDLEDIEIETPYQSSTLEKLNKKITKGYRPLREQHHYWQTKTGHQGQHAKR